MEKNSNFDAHRKEQVLRWANESTPAERLQFVEDALEFVAASGQNYHKMKRDAEEARLEKLRKANKS